MKIKTNCPFVNLLLKRWSIAALKTVYQIKETNILAFEPILWKTYGQFTEKDNNREHQTMIFVKKFIVTKYITYS